MSRQRILLGATLASVAILAAGLTAIVLAGAVNLPVWDEWEWSKLIVAAHTHELTFAMLWMQHNEHRLFFPQLLVLALDAVRGWDTIEETLLNVTLVVASLWIATLTIRRTIAPGRWPAVIVVTALLLFSLRQEENLIWGFQLAWFMVLLGVFGAVELLARPNRTSAHVAGAIAMAFVTSYCVSPGLLVWPTGLAAIVLSTSFRERRTVRGAIVWSVCGLIVLAIYFAGYVKPAKHPPLMFGFEHPANVLAYVAAYIGSPLSRGMVASGAELFGAVGLIAFALMSLRRGRSPEAAPWIALGSFSVLGAVVTAGGRAGFGVDQALSSRYVTDASILWVAVVALLAQIRYNGYPVRRLGVLAMALVGVPLFVRANQAGYDAQLAQKARLVQAYTAALSPESASESDLGILYPVPSIVRQRLEQLRAIKDGPFREHQPLRLYQF